jgi:hypothetical protein
MNLNLHTSHFKQIIENGYSLDMIFLLKLAEEEECLESFCNGSPKLEALYQGIYRKGLISVEDKLTLTGKSVLEFLTTAEETTKFVKKRKTSDDFELWWKAYPGTDTFKVSGKSFTGTRSLRNKKDECKIKLYKILEEGEYTIKDMIDALEFEVSQKMNNSIKTGVNKMTFMQNSLTYLNQRTFEPFIELIREGHKQEIDTPVSGSTDI